MKRFTETKKWEDSWYRKLTPQLNCLWQYICDRCDSAGVIDIDFESAGFHIGCQFSESDIASLDGRVVAFARGKFIVPKFITFQYGRVSTNSPAHVPIIRCLQSHGLWDEVGKCPIEYPIKYPTPTLSNRVQEEDRNRIGNGEGKEKGMQGENQPPDHNAVTPLLPVTNPPAVEFPKSFPKDEAQAAQWIIDAIPPEFTTKTWQAAASRGGTDAKGRVIESWRHHISAAWAYEQERIQKEKLYGTKTNGRISEKRIDRSIGTANEGIAAQFKGMR